MPSKIVLYSELPGYKPLPHVSALKVAGSGADLLAVTDLPASIAALKATGMIEAVVCNAPSVELLSTARTQHPKAATLLVTEDTMDRYSTALAGQEDVLVDHLIASRDPSPWTINELRVTLQKLLRPSDIFGLEKYLAPGTRVESLLVRGSADRETHNAEVMAYAEKNRLGQYLAKLVYGISEELLMNAVYDAPTVAGSHRYGDLPRTASVTLEPHEFATLNFGCDGDVFGLSVVDPFGALTRERLFQYIKKVLRRGDSANLIDTKKGGAGLGLFKILYSSHALICNVHAKKATEVMALIDIRHQVRDFSKMARSIHYFSAE